MSYQFLLVLFACLSTTLSQNNYPSLYCDYYSNPEAIDEGNYGDGFCSVGVNVGNGEVLLAAKTLVSNDNENSLSGEYSFPNYAVTRVNMVNFGRFHGSISFIGLLNEESTGVAQVAVNIFSGKGVRYYLEIYGVALQNSSELLKM